MRPIMARHSLLICFFLAGCGSNNGPDNSDWEQVQGTWKVVRHEVGGIPAGGEERRVAFRIHRILMWSGASSPELDTRFMLDPLYEPRRITVYDDDDLRESDGTLKEDVEREAERRKIVGIYRFESDGRMTLCFVKGSSTPSSTLNGRSHREFVLMTLERVDE